MTHFWRLDTVGLRLLVLTALLLIGVVACDLLGRRRRVEVDVKCDTAHDGVTCQVTRRSGKAAAQACWDMELTCANGRATTAHTYQKIPVGSDSVSTEVIPWTAFTHVSLCDRVSTMRIANVAVEVTT